MTDLLLLLHSALNIVIYSTLNPLFREKFTALFCRTACCNSCCRDSKQLQQQQARQRYVGVGRAGVVPDAMRMRSKQRTQNSSTSARHDNNHKVRLKVTFSSLSDISKLTIRTVLSEDHVQAALASQRPLQPLYCSLNDVTQLTDTSFPSSGTTPSRIWATKYASYGDVSEDVKSV
jgi:hypothetical protein